MRPHLSCYAVSATVSDVKTLCRQTGGTKKLAYLPSKCFNVHLKPNIRIHIFWEVRCTIWEIRSPPGLKKTWEENV